MKILILCTAFSGMAQRLLTELQQLGHHIEQHYDLEPQSLRQQVNSFNPQVILCPFLTQKIPEDIWREFLCLIIHPGIEGDRGSSSLDWAISENCKEWGVTLLQAADEMDAGDIWATQNFPLRKASKTSIYKREVTQAAIAMIKQTLLDIEQHHEESHPLDYCNGVTKGRLRPTMKMVERTIDWTQDSTEQVISKLNAADSRPGVQTVLNGYKVYLFGAIEESQLSGKSGDILAVHKGACCCATIDGAVWIRQLKCKEIEDLAPIKLPATDVLQKIYSPEQLTQWRQGVPDFIGQRVDDIKVERRGEIAYVYFNFYNGAMNTEQCIALRQELVVVKQSNAKVIVLMGGDDFWSNGIHLNCIEASPEPAQESWHNINAIDDVVMEIMDTPHQLTIAALRNNAGAGGAIMALACDEVIIRQGTVLNPHYKSMGLYGSEYWTYLLPKHVGAAKAQVIMSECQPMLAEEAVNNGMADVMLSEGWKDYHSELNDYCSRLIEAVDFEQFLSLKVRQFRADNARKPFADYRREELTHMKETFYNLGSEYHDKRRDFVYKIKKAKKTAVVQTEIERRVRARF